MSAAPRMVALGLWLVVAGGCGFEWKMVELPGGLYVDPATDEPARAKVSRAWVAAAEKVRDFYGSISTDLPDAYFCNSDTCRVYFAGPPMRSHYMGRGATVVGGEFFAARRSIIIVAIDERLPRTIAHELSHAELHERIAPNPVPDWFNEGLAMYVSGESCAIPVRDAVPDLRALTEGDAWMSETNDGSRGHAIYCQARREVSAWLDKNGRPRLQWLFERVKDGMKFRDAYGPLAIQPRVTALGTPR